ncbi:MAG: amidohydrolase [Flavobacteriales bacterium]|nr:amidohydrolase [Flavobacteriales bacterium]
MSSVLFYNGIIHTMDRTSSDIPEAVLVQNGVISQIGKLSDLEKGASLDLQKIDLKGQTLMPSFCDDLLFLWKMGQMEFNVLNLHGVKSMRELQQKVEAHAAGLKKGQWLVARGFNEVELEEKRIPDSSELDWVVSDRPAIIFRSCGHIAVLNSNGMRFCQIDSRMKDPLGGVIGRDTNGKPNGIFYEAAIDRVNEFVPIPSVDGYAHFVSLGSKIAVSKGITSATEPGVSQSVISGYQIAIQNKKLKVRMNIIKSGNTELRANQSFSTDTIKENSFNIDSYKFYLDGHLSGKTALIEDYYIDSDSKGVGRINEDILFDLLLPMYSINMKIVIHASGNSAIELAVKTFEKLSSVHNTKIAHRFENLALISKDQIKRLKSLNLEIVMNPACIFDYGSNYKKYLPPNYLEDIVPLRSMIDSGLNLSFGSYGLLEEDINPFVGIKAAVNRKDKNGRVVGEKESITVEEALYYYTMGGAQNNGKSTDRGSIELEKLADFIVLNKDPLSVIVDDLDTIEVNQTYLFGNLVYSRTVD